MPVQDVLSPQLQQASWSDKMSDKYLGTNKVATKNTLNDYNLQKAVNVNKYSWNQQGMIQAGINPLMNSGDLGNVTQSGASSQMSGDTGVLEQLTTGFVTNMVSAAQNQILKVISGEKTDKLLSAILKSAK